MDHIVNQLWLGSQQDADDLVRRNPQKISAILNVRGPDAYRPPGRDQSSQHPDKAYKWIPAPDIERIFPEHIREAVGWLEEQTGKGERILIHCMHGISRSPAFLAAFMVKRGMSASLEEAKATISACRLVHPAAQPVIEAEAPVVLIAMLTGLPNRQAFECGPRNRVVAAVTVDFLHAFVGHFGQIAGDAVLQRLARTLTASELDCYHDEPENFLCKGKSREELLGKLSSAQRAFRKGFQIYADGRMQTIQGMDFLFGIGEDVEEAQAATREASARSAAAPPEWFRKLIELKQEW